MEKKRTQVQDEDKRTIKMEDERKVSDKLEAYEAHNNIVLGEQTS